jgi:hypothetical protein
MATLGQTVWLIVGVCLLGGVSAASEPSPLPDPLRTFDARYALKRSGLRLGTTQMALSRHPRGWRYSSRTEAEGLAALFVDGPTTEETILEIDNGAVRPLRYRHVEDDADDRIEIEFDWDAATARVHRTSGEHDVALKPGTHDPFSSVLAVMGAVAAGAQEIRLPGIDNDGERTQLTFAVRAREQVEVPLGQFDAVRVHRVRTDDRSTVSWLAPELGWLPVRLEQRDDGDLVARAELEQVETDH